MSVLDQILEWGKTLPKWQQAALQLLYEKGSLSTADIEALVCVANHEAGLEVALPAVPVLTLAGSNSSVAGSTSVLTSVRDITNANALRAGQNLTFAPTGLTIVFGDNGAGKSGYVRILKQACHARGDGDAVITNIYSDIDTPPSATITYTLDGVDSSFAWSPGGRVPDELGQICVLDSKSAVVYANDDQPAVFLPFGLDLFPRLANVCDRVADSVRSAVAQAGRRDLFPDIKTNTAVRTLIDAIDRPHAIDRLQTLRVISAADSEQVDRLRKEIAQLTVEDPIVHAAALDQKVRRIAAVGSKLFTLAAACTEDVSTKVREARERLNAAEAAAARVSDEAFAHFPVKGLSHPSWQVLWDAALKFAADGAVPPQTFPPGQRDYCVLCQQPISVDAEARLASFMTFLADNTKAAVVSARTDLKIIIQAVESAVALPPFEESTLDEFDSLTPGSGEQLRRVISELGERLAAINSGASDCPDLPSALEDVTALIRKLESTIRADAEVLKAGANPTRLAAARKELDELDARMTLDDTWHRVETDLARGRLVQALERAAASAGTTSITNKGKTLLASAVSAPLAARFRDIITRLNLGYVPIEIAPMKGRKGVAVHRVRLNAAKQVPNSSVLSEGELRAVAIAGFLAEVEGQTSASTVVFDDPVSSLDYARRQYVAEALVAVSMRRPVIVFTHDPVFLWMLATGAEEQGVQLLERQLRRVGNDAGIVSDSISGSGKPAKTRIGPLRDRTQRLPTLQRDNPLAYESEVKAIYGELRDTWERAVEDCLFNGSVRRFSREIQTLRLARVYLITEAQVSRLDNGMTKCSRFLHDQPAEARITYPQPPEVLDDVDECKSWIKELSDQYNKN